MRLRLTDENWQWLRSTDHYSCQLQLSDANGTHLSVAEQYAALFRATEVAYNNATLLRPKSLVSLADKPYVNMRVPAKGDVATADYSKFSFTRVEKDAATPADKQMFSFSYINKDSVNLSERLSFDVRFGVVAEFATGVDVLWSHFTTAQRSSAALADAARFQFTAGVSDSIVTGEFCSFALSFLLKSPAASVDFAVAAMTDVLAHHDHTVWLFPDRDGADHVCRGRRDNGSHLPDFQVHPTVTSTFLPLKAIPGSWFPRSKDPGQIRRSSGPS